MIRLLLVGRAPVVREMIEGGHEGARFEIVAEVSTAAEAARVGMVDAVLARDAAAARELIESWDDEQWPAVVVLTRDERLASELAASGVPGWAVVAPDAVPVDLAAAIVAAVHGFGVQPASATMRRHVVPRRAVHAADEDHEAGGSDRLTSRERDVLELVSQGLGNKAIAARLGISDHTVKFHLSSIFSKLGVSSRTEAVRRGVRGGLISL